MRSLSDAEQVKQRSNNASKDAASDDAYKFAYRVELLSSLVPQKVQIVPFALVTRRPFPTPVEKISFVVIVSFKKIAF